MGDGGDRGRGRGVGVVGDSEKGGEMKGWEVEKV